MLLSMYLLYRYAKGSRPKSYLFDIGLLVVLISLVSTLFPVTWFPLLLSLFSFPFYFWVGELPPPAFLGLELRDRYPWLHYHSVRLLAVDLNLTPDWELSAGQITEYSLWSNYNNALLISFSILLLVNFLGGLSGYVLGRRREVAILNEDRWAVVGVGSIVASFVLFLESAFPLSVTGIQWMQVAGFLMILFLGLGVTVLGALALSFLIDYVERARVSTLMVLSGLIVFLVGQNASQALTIVCGSALVVFGGISYFVKLTVAYAKAHEPPASPEEQVEE